ncbi:MULTISPECIES: PepSY1/2 domain-containing protein [Bacillales]|uniref:Germination protein YpeB n=1 Tax=Lysinibacillus louembei TaxID=1470088 RepID=A0ABZ0RU43_9BACI|nr:MULTISPECIES: PepSY1/2 domain-containing protein [Bacillales]MCT6923139.1 germination protein YpeB [Metasolibacillus sp.]MCT6939556.1 germination protein YpeB [Metasolibacillus sp.]WPK11739.1 germination protein YpeB [Lysinibacillus louembei]
MKNAVYLLSIVVLILAVYAYDVTTKQRSMERAVHAHYTNELTNASEKLSLLHSSIAKSMLFQDEKALHKELDTIWRVSSDMRNAVSRLPLHQEVANDWMRYLGRIGDEAKRAAASQDATEWQDKMETVNGNLHALTEEWTVATTNYFQQDGDYQKWSKITADEVGDSSFAKVSADLKSFNETDFPLTASESDYQKKRELQHLMDEPLTKAQALQRLQTVFPLISDATMTVTKSRDDAPYPFYHIQFVRGSRIGYADITEKGGHILSFLLERPMKKTALPHEEVLQAAEKIMADAGYDDTVMTEMRENHIAWHFVFTRKVNDALVYPDSIQVKVAKDSGEVLGINAMEYIQKETIKEQELKPIDWSTFFGEGVVIEDEKKIYTENDAYELRLCYEVMARLPDKQYDTFRVVVDATTHDVIQIDTLA